MDETETTVAGSQQGQQMDENKDQTSSHKTIGENPQEQIHDDRVFRFRTGFRHN